MAKSFQGEEFLVTIKESSRTGLDQAAVGEFLAEHGKTLDDFQKSISFPVVSAVRLDASKKPQFEVPNASNYTLEGAGDMLGRVREQLSILKKEEEYYKQLIDTRLKEKDN